VPPHNISEIISACIALIDDPGLGFDELLRLVPGPGFPDRRHHQRRAGIVEAYKTGRGRISCAPRPTSKPTTTARDDHHLRAAVSGEQGAADREDRRAGQGKETRRHQSDGLRDESDKDGCASSSKCVATRSADVLLNNLFQQTQLQVTFASTWSRWIDGQPRTLSLREILEAFVRHRREVVTRRTIFELRKARGRAHILEGLTVALANIDEMIELIKTSPIRRRRSERMLARRWEPGLVRTLLAAPARSLAARRHGPRHGSGDGYQLSEAQAKEILEMRLNRLTGLEQEKLSDEYRELLARSRLIAILEDPDKLLK
jgi:DNA gyrase subunit A